MATYAIGDVQGCHAELLDLLARIGFDAGADRLWLAGDLVNRGPESLAVLRFVRDLGEGAVAILGNHDLHLLAASTGARPPKKKDTFADVLDAPDRDELLGWLRARPMLHRDPGLGYTMLHAGLPPQWTIPDAERLARELEAVLRGPQWRGFLDRMYGDRPDLWSEELDGDDRLRFVVNALTRMRYCTPDGRIDVDEDGPPGSQPAPLVPWYSHPDRASRGERIVFGHWATLGLLASTDTPGEIHHLDTGCVWGGSLTALRLEDRRWFQVKCPERSPRRRGRRVGG